MGDLGRHRPPKILDMESLSSEGGEARRYLSKKDLSDGLFYLLRVKNAYPELIKLLGIVLTLGISTASCERSFSCLKRLKTYLRATQKRIKWHCWLLSETYPQV